jgi:hypothetical protein
VTTAYLVGHLDTKTGTLFKVGLYSEFPVTQTGTSICQVCFTKERARSFDLARERLIKRCFGHRASRSYYKWLWSYMGKW